MKKQKILYPIVIILLILIVIYYWSTINEINNSGVFVNDSTIENNGGTGDTIEIKGGIKIDVKSNEIKGL